MSERKTEEEELKGLLGFLGREGGNTVLVEMRGDLKAREGKVCVCVCDPKHRSSFKLI